VDDAPLGTEMSNLAWVDDAVRIVREHGAEPASAAEVRAALAAIAGG
jgi:3-keto-5-aminohexanoate cleavage enzyme